MSAKVVKTCVSFEVLSECKVYNELQKCPLNCPYYNRNKIEVKKEQQLTKKQKRAIQRMATGLSIANNKKEYMRFMTLTTPAEHEQSYHYSRRFTSNGIFYFPIKNSIKYSFDILKKRIERASKEQIREFNLKHYTKLRPFNGFKFNKYFCLQTHEGNGVMHIIFWGKFIPQEWLKWHWDQIHGAFKADIRKCWELAKGKHINKVNGVAWYLLGNYMTNQPIKRMSYGWKWAWLGFCKSWERVKKSHGLLRKCASKKDVPYEVENVKPNTTTTFKSRFCSFKSKYYSAAIHVWNSTLHNPPATSRQIKFCNPDMDKWKKTYNWIIGKEAYVSRFRF